MNNVKFTQDDFPRVDVQGNERKAEEIPQGSARKQEGKTWQQCMS